MIIHFHHCSGAPRRIAVCKRTYEEYLALWAFYYNKLEACQPLGKLLSSSVLTKEMVNVLTIGRNPQRRRRENPIPCVPFSVTELVTPSPFNHCAKSLRISDFFRVNAPFYEFHRCQVSQEKSHAITHCFIRRVLMAAK